MPYKVVPMLRIFDYLKAVEFYVDWMGFQLDWEDKHEHAPVYMQISKEEIVLHLTEHHGDCCPGSKVFIVCSSGLRRYHSELIEKDYKYNRPGLDVAEWNALTMTVVDPFGNKLFFNEYFPAVATA